MNLDVGEIFVAVSVSGYSSISMRQPSTSGARWHVFGWLSCFLKVLTYRTFEPSCHTLTRLTKKKRSWKKQNALHPYKLSSFFSAPVYNLCAYGLQRHPEKPWPLPASSLRGIKYVSELSESSINHDVRNAEFSHETQALQVRSRESLLYDSFIYNTYLGLHVYN